MFEEKYKKDNSKIKPSEEVLQQIREMNADTPERIPQKPFRVRKLVESAVSLAAVLAIVITPLVMNKKSEGTGDTSSGNVIVATDNYKDIYSAVKSVLSQNSGRNLMEKGTTNDMATAPESTNFASDSSKTLDYSDTNLQVAGVQEADIIKTDGEYIYAVSFEYIYIIRADKGTLSIASKIKRTETTKEKDKEKNSSAFEVYVTKDRLVLLKAVNEYTLSGTGTQQGATKPDIAMDSKFAMWPMGGGMMISAEIYDISDKKEPKRLSDLGQSGSYVSSRMIGDILYIITNHYVYEGIKSSNPSTFVPSLYRDGSGTALKAEDVSLTSDPKESQFITITSIDTKNPGAHLSHKAVFGCGSTVYSSLKNIYIASYRWVQKDDYSYNTTGLIRFAVDSGKLTLAASGEVPGSILNQFSMDENGEYFRIVTTINRYSTVTTQRDKTEPAMDIAIFPSQNDTGNNLYVLDSQLKIIGKIEDLAKGERVYSVRFDGDIGYFVTFRQVDPLFAADLSDPKAPKILSELKIPGFSEYLHPYAKDRLFGLGKDADEKSGGVLGMKLSMFDVSDKTNLSEKHKIVLDSRFMWSEASYNHKAILVAPDKSLIAFPAADKYLVFSYSETNGFVKKAEIELDSSEVYYYQGLRGLYIGEYLYVYSPASIGVYSLQDFTRVSTLNLTK